MLQERPGRSRTKSEAARPNRHPMQEPRHADKELDNFMALPDHVLATSL